MSPFTASVAEPMLQPVGDEVLAAQTGKAVGVSTISGFVLNLLSQWQLPNGESVSATGTLAVSKTATGYTAKTGATAIVNELVSQTNQAVNTYVSGLLNNGANGATTTGGENVQVNGVSQVTQVAGNNNVGSNTATIDFSPTSAASQILNGQTSANASGANGLAASIAFNSTGAVLKLTTPAGVATQQVTANATQSANIAQLMKIAGNNQAVMNQLQLHLQTSALTANQLRLMGVQAALANMTSLKK
ncbi:peptidase C39 [Pararobbsia silviterrae]|nr:peptidase C39 [Pararobbsia silviterrae]